MRRAIDNSLINKRFLINRSHAAFQNELTLTDALPVFAEKTGKLV
ncbi:hypothetical protein [Sphingobacterium bambusae]|uniref:Uncharacterized protein n=1 Tax=Sphingobacterium bambusae TaxID=662858 RepID=A0ABW6BP12_9SPHI|nr:hypothetical protein [Sphingobacterium bambusae]WPL47966.1 hypothetical protein SCB77_18615 [Sphingobacterium bambusae]